MGAEIFYECEVWRAGRGGPTLPAASPLSPALLSRGRSAAEAMLPPSAEMDEGVSAKATVPQYGPVGRGAHFCQALLIASFTVFLSVDSADIWVLICHFSLLTSTEKETGSDPLISFPK